MVLIAAFRRSPSVLKGAEMGYPQKDPIGQILGYTFFLTYSLLVDILRDATVGMAQEFLCRLEVDALLPQRGCQPIA